MAGEKEYIEASRRTLLRHGDATDADREIIRDYAHRINAALKDCREHAVDWRARALAAEAELIAAREIVEAAATLLASEGYEDQANEFRTRAGIHVIGRSTSKPQEPTSE
jgi:hypothetical protein